MKKSNNKQARKADKATAEQRVKDIATLLINGNSREVIVRLCSEKYGVGERQADKYIARAKELVEQSVKRNVNYEHSKAVRRYEDLYRLSVERTDYKTALAANRALTELQGLLKQQIEHSGEVKFISSIPD